MARNARILFHDEAAAELIDAVGWYRRQRRGLEREFLREIRQGLRVVKAGPEVWPLAAGVPPALGIRRYLVRRFPYAICYRVRSGNLEVLAVAHHSRRPGYWRGRT